MCWQIVFDYKVNMHDYCCQVASVISLSVTMGGVFLKAVAVMVTRTVRIIVTRRDALVSWIHPLYCAVSIRACIHTQTQTHTHAHTHTCTHTRTHTHACMHACTHAHTHTHKSIFLQIVVTLTMDLGGVLTCVCLRTFLPVCSNRLLAIMADNCVISGCCTTDVFNLHYCVLYVSHWEVL